MNTCKYFCSYGRNAKRAQIKRIPYGYVLIMALPDSEKRYNLN